MEDQLSALGERWSHVCQWAEQRAIALTELVNHWSRLDYDWRQLVLWLSSHEQSLRQMEANPNLDKSQMMEVGRQLQLLERDLGPHQDRLAALEDGARKLTVLMQASAGSEAKLAGCKYVERLLLDMEDFEDRIEALNEIMDAQRQRVNIFFLRD